MKYLRVVILVAICLPIALFGQGISLKNVKDSYKINSSFRLQFQTHQIHQSCMQSFWSNILIKTAGGK